MATTAKLSRRGPHAQRDGYKVYMWLENNTSGGSSSASTTIVAFPINPEDVQTFYPTRINTQQTIGGAYQDNWGPGVGKVQMSGITGWGDKNPEGSGDPKTDTTKQDGYQFFITLRELHKRYQELCGNNDPNKVDLRILIPPGDFADINAANTATAGSTSPLVQGNGSAPVGTQFGFFRVSADNFQAGQSRSEPQLYRYRWEMTVLRDLLSTTIVNPSLPFMVDPSTLQQTDDPLQNITPGDTGSTGGAGGTGGTGTTPGGDGSQTTPVIPVGSLGSNPNNSNSTVYGPTDPVSGVSHASVATAAADATKAAVNAGQPAVKVQVPPGNTAAQVLASNGISVEEWKAYQSQLSAPSNIDPTKQAPGGVTTTIYEPPQAWLDTFRAETGTAGPKPQVNH